MEHDADDLHYPYPLDLVALDESTWRVGDRRYDDGDPRRILGYLAECAGEYEMLWMRPRIGVRYLYPSIEDAVRAIATRLLVTEPL
jgi:hypothetical protein